MNENSDDEIKKFRIETLISRAPCIKELHPPIKLEIGGAFGEVGDLFKNILAGEEGTIATRDKATTEIN